MGIYDREYYQDDRPPGFQLGGERMAVTNLVIANVMVFVLAIFFQRGADNVVNDFLSLKSGTWNVWQLLTYGFVHSTSKPWHIIGNMFMLWFFGRDIEASIGKRNFLFFYFTALIFAGLVGGYGEGFLLQQREGRGIELFGASGGVAAVVMLYVFRFPHRTLVLWPFGVPIRAWVLGAVMIAIDFVGTFYDDGVSHSAHLAGAAYGYLFFRTQWSLGNLVPANWSLKRFKRSPKFRIHDPGHDEELTAEVDRILEKISREGESSLTRKERRTLEAASRHFKQRR